MKILVIGGGPGGYVAAIRAAQLGAEVTLVEKEKVGGTCLNVGCIPTKALLHSAEVYQNMLEAAQNGISAENVTFDFGLIQQRKAAVVKQMTQGVNSLLEANGVSVVSGKAMFKDAVNVCIETTEGLQELQPDKTIIASGSVSSQPPISGIDGCHCIDSTGALAQETVPESMVIIGGGVIGVEMASIYSTFGTKITILEMMDEILPMMDIELVKILRRKLKKCGIDIQTSAKVTSVDHAEDTATVHVEKGGKEIAYTAQNVLVCIGRKANVEDLQLQNAGVAMERNTIIVNERLETNVPNIYAIGDCRGGIMLAHTASEQGEIAAENAMGADRTYSAEVVPSCVYTDPEIASVGLTEAEAEARGIALKVGRFPIMGNGKCVTMGYTDGMIKLLADSETDEVIGAQILAPRATDLIAECTLAIARRITTEQLIETIHAHPTVSEVIREAALDANHRAIHIYRP